MSEIDPVELPILWNRLIQIADECWTTIWKAAFSTVIGEALDFGVEILDSRGESLAHAAKSMPLFHFCLPNTVHEMLNRFPVESLSPGDVLITNDPWLCAGHLPDIAVISPVFYRGSVVAIMASVGNVADIGGTKNNASAHELYEEGILIPPMHLYKSGVPVQEVFEMLGANVRVPEMVLGDLQALVAANRVGEERLVAFLEEYELDNFEQLAEQLQDRTEEAMRAAIREVEDGIYSSTVTTDHLALRDEQLSVHIEVAGDSIAVDYSPAPAQAKQGGVNCTPQYTIAHTLYALKLLLTPEIPSNSGNFRPIDVTIPSRTILAAEPPASVALRIRTGWHIHELIFKALAKAMPHSVQAGSGLATLVIASGEKDSRAFDDSLFLGGGQGAMAGKGGLPGLLYPTSAGNVSVEVFESRTPLLVEEKSFVEGSGGSGRYVGGVGERIVLRRVPSTDADITTAIGAFPEGFRKRPAGLEGGGSGTPARVLFNDEQLEDGTLVHLKDESDRLVIEMPGGGGWGKPVGSVDEE